MITDSRTLTEGFDEARICINGHLINGYATRLPLHNDLFCSHCGGRVIGQCPSCNAAIRGGELGRRGMLFDVECPNCCRACGAQFPWTSAAMLVAKEYAGEIPELSPAEQETLKGTLDDLAMDTPRTEVAAARFKKLAAKAGPVAGAVLQKVVEAVATAAAKASLGL